MLSRAISSLVADGLVARSSDDGDRRAAWVKSTAAGRKLAERMRRERTEALNRALAGLSEDDRDRSSRRCPPWRDWPSSAARTTVTRVINAGRVTFAALGPQLPPLLSAASRSP